jgi:hypothetical protein
MTNDYNLILKKGECFYKGHTNLTILELKSCLDMMKISHRLPNCFWEEIKHIHATNVSTIWSLTNRWFDFKYPNTVGNDKPTISLLNWIYEGIVE